MNIEKMVRLCMRAVLAGDVVLGLSIVGFLLLFTLKLSDKIDWSWWAVFAPLYVGIPAGVVIALGTIFGLPLLNANWKPRAQRPDIYGTARTD